MATSTESTPKFLLEELGALSADGLDIHSVVDVEASASGEMLRAEAVVQPGGGGGPLHRHRFQEERFEMLDGEIVGRIGGSRRRVRAGETFVVPPDAPHTFSVEADEPARFITEFRPGLRLAEFFAQLFWLADHGHVDAKGRIHPLQAAALARAFPSEFFYLPRIPAPLQQAIARPLAALARRRGYTADPAGLAEPAARVAAHGNGNAAPVHDRHAAPVDDRRVSHPDPSAPADRRAIEPGEVWENPVTRERAVIVEVPWHNSEGRAVAELTALPAARVMGEHLHPALHERFSVLEGELTMGARRPAIGAARR
jgi:quercetin dioxygenase-like cupin family protein